jgi:phage terminase Nu1 subunit (DNA packaging protein)
MTITATQLARKYDVSRKTVYEWLKEGCPEKKGGGFDLAEVNTWRAGQLGHRDEKNKTSKAYWQVEKWKLDCKKIKQQIDRDADLLHDKSKCAASLLEIRAIESRTLHGLGAKIASQFPEVTGLKAAIEKETDAIVKRLKQ